MNHAHARKVLASYDDRKLAGVEDLDMLEEEANRMRSILDRNPVTNKEIARAGDGSIRRALREAGDTIMDAAKKTRLPKDTTFREGIGRLAEIPGMKRLAVGAALLVGGSILYQHHKDITPETHNGGDFIPGGSNYEQNYSRPGMGIPGRPYGSSGGGGTTYVVNATGAHDPNALISGLEGVSGTQAYGTINTRHNPSFDVAGAIAGS